MNQRQQTIAAFASVYLLWGSTFVAIRYAAPLLHPALLSGLRYAIASVVLFGWLILRKQSIRLQRQDALRAALLGLLMFSVNTSLVNFAGKTVSAATIAFFLATIPLFVVLLERLTPSPAPVSGIEWLAICGGLLGIFLLTRHNVRNQPLTGAAGIACMALLVAAIAWAVGTVASRRLAFRTSPLLLGAWQMCIAGVVNLSWACIAGGVSTSHWTAKAWLAVLYLAIPGSVVCYTSYLFLLRTVRLPSVAAYAYVNPLVAALLGWLLLGERPRGTEWAGMAVVLASVAVAVSCGSRRAVQTPEPSPPLAGGAHRTPAQ